jgi:membrane-associated phospholipid phosphatase
MSFESSIVRTLNAWGELHTSLIRVCSNDLVYVVILLSVLWFLAKILKAHSVKSGWKDLVVNLLVKGTVIFAIPVGIATLISELISTIYVRQRPFVVDSHVRLLVPHGADGGMPSHHIVFMVTLIVTIYFYEKKIATLFALLTLLTGIARVAAGIHYPSDIVAGAILGTAVAYLYRWGVMKAVDQKRLYLD